MTDLDRIIAEMGDCSLSERVDGGTVRDWRNRLAALAGAAPVATFTVTSRGPCAPDFDMDWLADYRDFADKGPINLYTHPHAPAKAREDVVLALPAKWRTDAMLMPAGADDYFALLNQCADDLDAALATFAEGGAE